MGVRADVRRWSEGVGRSEGAAAAAAAACKVQQRQGSSSAAIGKPNAHQQTRAHQVGDHDALDLLHLVLHSRLAIELILVRVAVVYLLLQYRSGFAKEERAGRAEVA